MKDNIRRMLESVSDGRITEEILFLEQKANETTMLGRFENYILPRGFVMDDISSFVNAYNCILNSHGCFGPGVDSHTTYIQAPYTSNVVNFRYVYESLSGLQYYQNCFYGVACIDFGLWDSSVEYEQLTFIHKTLSDNILNARFILCDLPDTVLDLVSKWNDLSIKVIRPKTDQLSDDGKRIGF